MIDMTSNGRLVSGYVRGAGTEQYANNVNPAYNRERFEEAHDLLIKLWTTPGPFRWEGKHYQYRVVNPWALPVQKPHPRIWIPGVGSTETIVWAAKHRYPYIGLNTKLDMTTKIWETYDQAAREVGYEAGPEQHGYLLRVHVSDSMEKAERNAREFMWMHGSGHFTGLGHPVWVSPPGYDSASSRRMRLTMKFQQPTFEEDVAEYNTIYGTPDKVIKDLRHLVDKIRPGILILWGNDGRVQHEDSMTCIRLLGEEVLPAVREHGKELGLGDPFELNTPVSLAATPPAELSGAAAG
jgi:alkanesulfonate monooxygenase SsuD/methylene tetrahydromethanopterin reductase-like flavin-dependent oxidoreductase (luciferase family)